ncbi:MAG: hypothetical protein HY248_00580, partial [Fimbriimonas ginsengisoli]|nr:hypothetical protein [Fimbriimonas ginsengisoli]
MKSIQVEAALAQDDELRREAEAYRQISGSVKTLAFSPEPMGLERTLGALSSASGAGSGAKRRYPWVLALGAGLAVILGVQLFFPVFAQSKEAAKASSELMMAGRERSDQQAAQSPHYFGADDPGKGVKLMDTKEAGAKPRRKIDTGPSDELGSQAPASGLS